MDFLLWTERYRKKTNYSFYIPEYVVVCKLQNGVIKEKTDLRIRMPIQPDAVESDLIKGFNAIISMIKANVGCTMIYVSERDVKICQRVFKAANVYKSIKHEYILNPEEYKIITNGKPATNANSRRSHAGKAVTSYLSGRYNDIVSNSDGITKIEPCDYTINKSKLSNIGNNTDNKQAAQILTEPINRYVRLNNSIIYHMRNCKILSKRDNNSLVEVKEDELQGLKPCGICLHGQDAIAHDNHSNSKCISCDEDSQQIIDNKNMENTIRTGDSKENTNDKNKVSMNNSNKEGTNTHNKIIDENDTSKNSHSNSLIINYDGVDPLGKYLIDICSKYGIYCEIVETTIIILTAAGGWKFDYTKRPIQLYHQNYKNIGNTIANLEYHIQQGEFIAPLNAIVYIINHDNRRIEAELKKLIKD